MFVLCLVPEMVNSVNSHVPLKGLGGWIGCFTVDVFCSFVILTHSGACLDGRVLLSIATDCSLSLSTAQVQVCEKVASDLGLGSGFLRYSGFLHHLQLVGEKTKIVEL